MGEGYNFIKLSEEIISRSLADDWLQAKLEWDLEYVYEYPPHKTCLCGHHPIENICVIRNDINRTRAEVGNVCVHKFLGMQSKRVFAALRRVRADITKSLNPKSIEMFMSLRVVSAQDADLYLEFWRKRKHVTPDQMKLRVRINEMVLAYADKRSAG